MSLCITGKVIFHGHYPAFHGMFHGECIKYRCTNQYTYRKEEHTCIRSQCSGSTGHILRIQGFYNQSIKEHDSNTCHIDFEDYNNDR